jgi:hypothetical protein
MLLYAAGISIQVDSDKILQQSLLANGFIGECFERHESFRDYFVGSAFLDLVTFLGCSPSIALHPDEDAGQGFCFIRMHALDQIPKLYSGSNTLAPLCKRCNQKRQDWFEGLQLPGEDGLCSDCSRMDLVDLLAWRKRGALTRLAIEIMNIYPHEAVPSPALITQLEKDTAIKWGHAYLQAQSNA